MIKINTVNQKAIDVLVAYAIIKIVYSYYGIENRYDFLHGSGFPYIKARRQVAFFIDKYTDTISKSEICIMIGRKPNSHTALYKTISDIQFSYDNGIGVRAIVNMTKLIESNLKTITDSFYEIIKYK